VQLLHHAAIFQIEFAIIVYASPRKIIRLLFKNALVFLNPFIHCFSALLFQFSPRVLQDYLELMTHIKEIYFPWVYDSSITIPSFSQAQLGRLTSIGFYISFFL